jgi:sugar-specific transcriptional regulator TrmB
MLYTGEVIERILTENGFNDKEARVYLAVLQAGEATVASIASKAHIERTTVYSLLEDMKQKGLISITKRRGIQYLSALPPRVLVDRFKQSASLAEQALPALLEMAYASPLKPRIRFYEGIEGLKEILLDFSHSKQQSMGFTDYEAMPKELFAFIRKRVVPNRRERGIAVQLIVPRNETNVRLQKEDSVHFGEHRLVDFPLKHGAVEVLLYGESSVAFLSFSSELFGVIIDSSAIHQTLENIFQLVWRSAEPASS